MSNPTLKNTFLYKQSNVEGILKDFISKGKIATYEQLRYPLDNINRYFKFPLKIKVLSAFKTGMIQLYYAPPGYTGKMPLSMPFRLYAERGTTKAAIFIDNYAKLNKNGTIEIDPKKLYCYMEGAYVAIMFNNSFKVLSHNPSILTELCSIYAHMFTRILTKRFALNVQQRTQDKVLFLAAKFFMINMLGLENDTQTFNYALRVSSNLSPVIVRELDDAIKTEDYADLHTFISALVKYNFLIVTALNNYSTRAFIEDFVNMYGSMALYAAEDVEYLLFNVLSAMNGGFINKQYAFDNIIGNNGNKIYNAIEKVCY